MLQTLDHVIVAVADLDSAALSYELLLGVRPSWRGRHPGQGTENVLFRLANTYIELLAPVGGGGFAKVVRSRLDSAGEGLFGLAFGTPDAGACVTELRSRGLEAHDPVPGSGRDLESGAERRWLRVPFPTSVTPGYWCFAIEHLSPADALPWGEKRGDGPVHALDHVVIRAGDAEATKTLYGDALGLRLALDRTFESRRVRLLFFRVGGATVEVSVPLSDSASGDEGDTLYGLAYQVANVDSTHARLLEAGASVSHIRDGNKPGTRVFTVRDGTCGVPTLIIQPTSLFRS